MEKLYDRIDWHNNTTPAINETNLNKMSKALDDLDDRVILIAGDILVTVPELQEMLEDCTELEQRLEAMTENPPYIGENGHWYIWDTDTGAYVDSGIDASITVEIADITMLEPNATPYVTNTGTDTDPIFHLFIPRGQPGKGISSIAKTGTSGYVDTYTITYTDNTTTTYTVTNGRNTDQVTTIPTASAALVDTIYQYVGASTSDYTHGFYYECVNDGGVYKWVNIPVGNDPVEVSNSDPYTYRKSLGNLADMEIVGASVGWNQLVQNGNFASTSGWDKTPNTTLTASNHELTVSTSADGNKYATQNYNGIAGHKYLINIDYKSDYTSNLIVVYIGAEDSSRINFTNTVTGQYQRFSKVFAAVSGSQFSIRLLNRNSLYSNKYKNVWLIDLTALFGSATIADHIYSLEQAQEGSGIAWIKKYGFFYKDYFAYDPGSIQSVCIASRKVTGKNVIDIINPSAIESYVTVVDNETIAFARSTYTISNFCVRLRNSNTGTYVDNLVKTQDGSYSFTFTHDGSYNIFRFRAMFSNNSDAQISWDIGNLPYGEYTVYVTYKGIGTGTGIISKPHIGLNIATYPFDSTKQIRGMFDIVNGELKANGDVWRGDKIQRNWLEPIDLGTYNWSINNLGYFTTPRNSIKKGVAICSKYYIYAGENASSISSDKQFAIGEYNIIIRDDAYSDAATFKTAMSGVYLLAQSDTPTTESAQPYQNPQRAYIDGTEEFIDGLTRDVMIPVGNNTTYQQDKILPSVEDYVDSITDTKTDISAIATEENGATASKAYTTGQHFYKDGKFCTAIANIASNAAFTLNTNYVEGTIAQAIEAINVSGGHTIVNSSGSSMTARSKLKFANATVTDDPANDQTVITTNPASSRQEATLEASFEKVSQDSGVYYVTRGGYCEVHIINIRPKSTGQGLLVVSGLPRSMYDGIIMGGTPNFEDGTAFYVRTDNNVTKLYALIPDTNSKQGTVFYMMMN